MPKPIKRQKVLEAGMSFAKRYLGPDAYKQNKKAAKWLQQAFTAGAYWRDDQVNGLAAKGMRSCRCCGCTDNDCRQCIEKTGHPCHWIEPDLCSACEKEGRAGA